MVKLPKNSNDKKSGRHGLKPSDQMLWDHVAKTVKPLGNRNASVVPDAGRKIAKKTNETLQISNMKPALKTSTPIDTSVDKRTEDRFRKGKMDIEAVLDLHGLTVAKAQPTLVRFILKCHSQGLRCVLVITGKGKGENGQPSGILRRSLRDWLADAALAGAILKCTPSKPKDGGDGAFYILLRRVR